MKCVLVVHSGDDRMKRSCDLPDGVSTQKQLRAFVQSQDLRLDSVDFTLAVSLVEVATAKKGQKVVLRSDADVQQLLKTAAQQRTTHILTFDATISGSAASPRSLGSLLSMEYAVDKDLVTLHVFSPPTCPSRANSPSHREKTFIIPTRFVLASLARAVEDTLSISPTKEGMKLVLYTMPQQHSGDPVEIIDDTAALRLLRQHASQRTPARLTYGTRMQTPKASSRHMSRRTSQQQFTAPLAPSPSPLPLDSTVAMRKLKPHPPPLSNLVSEPPSPSSSEPSQAPPERKGETSSSLPSRKVATPSSPAPPSSSPSAAEVASSSAESSNTLHCVFLREGTTPIAKYETRVQVRPAAAAVCEFRFVYTKEEMNLWRRFAAECESAAGAATGSHVPVLSNDSSVCLDSDSVLREWLALAKESQQPLRVRLSLHHPTLPPLVKAESSAAPTAESPVANRGALSAESAAATANTGESDSSPAGEKKRRPGTAAPAASLPLSPRNGDSSERGRVTERRVASSQRRSLTSLQGVSTSSEPLNGSPTKVDSAASSPRRSPLFSDATSPSEGATRAKGATAKVSEDDIVEADSPPLVICTTAGLSSDVTTAACLSCVCEDDGDDGSSVRFQVSACWGAEKRMVLCRLREGTALDDLRCAALDTFCNGVAGTDGAPPLVMEMTYVAEGQLLCVPLDGESRLRDLRGKLLADSAELHVTAPPIPPPPQLRHTTNGKSSDVARVEEAVLRLLADAVEQHFVTCPPTTSADISTFLRAQLGEQATTEPLRRFLDVSTATPFNVPTSDLDVDASSSAPLLPWFSSVLARMQAEQPAATGVSLEVASLLLRSRLCDVDFLLDQFAAAVPVVGDEGDGIEAPSTTVRPSLAALWTEVGLVTPQSSSAAAWNPFRAAYVGGTGGWKAAYAAAPAAMLDLVAAGTMDGVWAFPRRRDTHADIVWQRGLSKALRDCCESINPTELERYFKSGDCPNSDDTPDHRRVILSCVGVLLAPPSAAVGDYAEWLKQHFRGKVATVLYTNMVDYDGNSSLSAFTVTQLSWVLLHPQLRRVGGPPSSPTTLHRLHDWALLATESVCQRRNVHFPPCPLLHVHTASPVPFAGPSLPGAVTGSGAATDVETETQMPRVSSRPPCGVAAASAPPAASLCPSPPSSGAPHPAAHKAAPPKVQYNCRYNFSALHKPRSVEQ
ncbi:hypothetical_protein [Leishmania braziliensis MHOM/BR/75/M2904]|uniref:Hypothetical_protein n=1 Tax=Leishmania braziliensis MHOM/BR/75/M2904 TaxID=420245 RepID=A0A3P3Z5F2_LEIBR|nr:hypothetical_protein [Leishmania braziliensis MHOM/BR/75/M2904]